MRRPSPLLIYVFLFWAWTSQAFALLDTVQITNLSDFNLPTWNMGGSCGQFLDRYLCLCHQVTIRQ